MEMKPTILGKIENKIIEREEFNVKENQRYNVSVLINHHQDLDRMISSDVRSPIDLYQKCIGDLMSLDIILSKS